MVKIQRFQSIRRVSNNYMGFQALDQSGPSQPGTIPLVEQLLDGGLLQTSAASCCSFDNFFCMFPPVNNNIILAKYQYHIYTCAILIVMLVHIVNLHASFVSPSTSQPPYLLSG